MNKKRFVLGFALRYGKKHTSCLIKSHADRYFEI